MCATHAPTVTGKGLSTQPLGPQGLVTKAREKNEAENAVDSRWKPQAYKYSNLETDNGVRAALLPSVRRTRFQAPDTKIPQRQISSSESQLPPSVAGNVAPTRRLEQRGGSKNQCFHWWPIKTSLFLPIRGCTILRFFFFFLSDLANSRQCRNPIKSQAAYLSQEIGSAVPAPARKRKQRNEKYHREPATYCKSSHSHGCTSSPGSEIPSSPSLPLIKKMF